MIKDEDKLCIKIVAYVMIYIFEVEIFLFETILSLKILL
jgi:hypothetical protein